MHIQQKIKSNVYDDVCEELTPFVFAIVLPALLPCYATFLGLQDNDILFILSEDIYEPECACVCVCVSLWHVIMFA